MSRTEPSVDLNWCETHVIVKAVLPDSTIIRLGSATLTDVPEPDTLDYSYIAKIVKDSQVKISTTRTADQMTFEAENVDKELGLTLNDVSTVLTGAKVTCSKVFTNIATKVKATGTISFPGIPANGNIIVVNGITFTYRTASPIGNEILIGVSAAVTATNTAAVLNASKLPSVYMADYVNIGTTITATYKLGGSEGNQFTLAKTGANISISGATLTGGALGTRVWQNKLLLTGEISYVEASQEAVTIKIVSDTAPSVAFISTRPVQKHCPLIFKSLECGYSGGLTTCNKVYESMDGCLGREQQHRFAGVVIKGELPQIINGGIDTDVFDPERTRGFGGRYPDPDEGRVRIPF